MNQLLEMYSKPRGLMYIFLATLAIVASVIIVIFR